MNGIANVADVQAIEDQLPEFAQSTYDLIAATARAHPEAPALSFFMRSEDYARPEVLDYRTLFGQITAAANLFHELGIKENDVVAFVLPNLPETHLTIWGGQAAGIVFAVNPLLEPSAIAELLTAGEVKVLVTLAPFPGFDLWERLQPVLGEVRGLRHVVVVSLACHTQGMNRDAPSFLQTGAEVRLHGAAELRAAVPKGVIVHDFTEAVNRQPMDRLVSGRVIRSTDTSSYFCTGGTTGTPRIAMRTHGNEVANAWSSSQVVRKRVAGTGQSSVACPSSMSTPLLSRVCSRSRAVTM